MYWMAYRVLLAGVRTIHGHLDQREYEDDSEISLRWCDGQYAKNLPSLV